MPQPGGLVSVWCRRSGKRVWTKAFHDHLATGGGRLVQMHWGSHHAQIKGQKSRKHALSTMTRACLISQTELHDASSCTERTVIVALAEELRLPEYRDMFLYGR